LLTAWIVFGRASGGRGPHRPLQNQFSRLSEVIATLLNPTTLGVFPAAGGDSTAGAINLVAFAPPFPARSEI
jgi:hypothetical protein